MLIFLRGTGVLGALLFGLLLSLLLFFPAGLERSALSFTKSQIETEMLERYPDLIPGQASEGLQRLSETLGFRQNVITEQLKTDLPEIIAFAVEQYCGCASTLEARTEDRAAEIRAGMAARFDGLGATRGRIADIIIGQYDATVAALRQDVMIFLGTNLLAFLSVLGATFAPKDRRGLVFYPAIILIIAVGISSSIYLFETDWFYTIIFQSYMGWGYGLILLVIFGFLVDILLNYARVTLKITANLPFAFVPSC